MESLDSLRVYSLLSDHAGFGNSFYAQHGLSLLLEATTGKVTKRILLDTGQEAEPVLHNMKLLGLDPATVDMVFLSHCHNDHTQGLLAMLDAIGKPVPVIAHPDIFRPNYSSSPSLHAIGMAPGTREEILDLGAELILAADPFPLMDGVLSTGEIEPITEFEEQGIGTYNLEDGRMTPDFLRDDISLVANVKGKGLVIATGCSHAGIINIVRQAQRISGVEHVAAVIGGLHLVKASAERIEKTAAAFVEIAPDQLIAGHCTGFSASFALAQALGTRFTPLSSGLEITF